jgi:uncharacterized protein (TIGR02678 family)
MSLTDALAADRERQLVRARRRLLTDPLLHKADEPELWPVLLRHRDELARWFMANLGWRLVVDPAGGFARLHKVAAHPDPTRPATLNDTALTVRKYTLLLLAGAALDEQPRQTTLSVLSERVAELSAAEDVVPTFDPSNSHADRLAFAGAVKWLAANRVLNVRDGSLDAYITDPGADALLDVNDRLLTRLLSCPTSPALVEDPADVLHEVYPAGGTARAGHQVLRRLADDPVVYFDELTDDERAWLTPRWQVVNRFLGDLGLVVERRAEGLAGIDPSLGEPLSDRRFPTAGSTVAHCALLLAEHLVGRHQAARQQLDGPDAGAPRPVPLAELVGHVRVLIGDYAARCGWAQWVLGDDAPDPDRPEAPGQAAAARLTKLALDELARFGLVRRDGQVVVPAPASARFGVAAAVREVHVP